MIAIPLSFLDGLEPTKDLRLSWRIPIEYCPGYIVGIGWLVHVRFAPGGYEPRIQQVEFDEETRELTVSFGELLYPIPGPLCALLTF